MKTFIYSIALAFISIFSLNANAYPHHIQNINLGGISQSIMIIGDTLSDKPVLLYLHGHAMPGSLFAYYYYKTERSLLSEKFIIVHWDQRGCGRSFSKDIDPVTMNIPQFISDANELTNILLTRFNKKKLYLFGQSWGSMLGMKLVHAYPDKFYSYISEGQVSDMQGTFRHMYTYILENATEHQDKKVIRKMTRLGMPDSAWSADQYQKFTRKAFRWYEHYIQESYEGKSFIGFFREAFKNSPDFDRFGLKVQTIRGLFFTMNTTGDELLNIDLNHEIDSIAIPYCMILGEYDFMKVEATRYFSMLYAPRKNIYIIPDTAHAPSAEQPEKFEEIFIDFIFSTAASTH